LPFKVVNVDNPLPSDSKFREDLTELLNGNEVKAEEEKDRLEVLQRRDRKLREAAQKAPNKH